MVDLAEHAEVAKMLVKDKPIPPSESVGQQEWLEWLLKVTDRVKEDLGKKETLEIIQAIYYYMLTE